MKAIALITLASLAMAMLSGCSNPTVEASRWPDPSGVLAQELPAGADQTHRTRISADEELVAYTIGDPREPSAFCVEYLGPMDSMVACWDVDEADPPAVVVRPATRGAYAVAFDPLGRIDRLEALARGCGWVGVGLEQGHLAFVWAPYEFEQLGLVAGDGTVLEGEALPLSAAHPSTPGCTP